MHQSMRLRTMDAAYASPPFGLNFARTFRTLPELKRVSVMLHQGVDVTDPASGRPNVHIRESYATPAAAPGLPVTAVTAHAATVTAHAATVSATRDVLMSTADRLHNPSSYAASAWAIFVGHGSRQDI